MPSDTLASARAPVPVRGRGRFEPQMDADEASNDPRPAMGLMASVTGGRYFHNTNDLAAGFKQTVNDMQGSYTLGFYMPGDPDDKWHKLKVKVNRRGTEALYRQGYLAESMPSQAAGVDARNVARDLFQPYRLHGDSVIGEVRMDHLRGTRFDVVCECKRVWIFTPTGRI